MGRGSDGVDGSRGLKQGIGPSKTSPEGWRAARNCLIKEGGKRICRPYKLAKLELRSWDDAREAAHLWLTAFGGEARDEKECVTARIDLRDWLLKRNQNDTAEIVKRYFTFPIYPLGQISRVGLRTATAMKAIADAAGGQWPLPESLEPAWRRFVITAFREDVAFEPEELTRWFAANGWDAHAAAELTRRFGADAAFLAEYEEEARPA